MIKCTMLAILLVIISLNSFSGSLSKVKMNTSFGEIIVELDTVRAPISANNFLQNVKNEVYKDAIFYRVVRPDNQPNSKVKIEVIQGGIYTQIRFGEIPKIEHETTEVTGIKHLDGTISMARSKPGSASTEFFICVGEQPELDFGGTRNPDGQGFAAFGRVIDGMDVVRKIQEQKDLKQTLVTPIKITSTELL